MIRNFYRIPLGRPCFSSAKGSRRSLFLPAWMPCAFDGKECESHRGLEDFGMQKKSIDRAKTPVMERA